MQKTNPYKLFWYSTPFIFLAFFLTLFPAFDIQKHDTYFVFGSIHLAMLIAMIFGLIGLLYWIFRTFKLLNGLTKVHAYLTFISIGLIFVSLVFHKRYVNLNSINIGFNSISLSIFSILSFMLVQAILIYNIIIGFVRGKIDEY